jgi:hypothetical protein
MRAVFPIEREAMRRDIKVFDKPIERIKDTCDLLGIAGDFDLKRHELETHLEGLVASGETDEQRLTVSGLCFLKGNGQRSPLRRTR